MQEHLRIDALVVTGTRLSQDGGRVLLDLVDAAGCKVRLSVPIGCVDAISETVPRRLDPGAACPLSSWSLAAARDGRGLLLTLRTPEGREVSFFAQPWQLQGMATIATHAVPSAPPAPSVH